jgi:putative ABC transport system permease protein
MRQLRAWLLRFAGLFTLQRRDQEIAEELESHLGMHIQDNLRAGMPPVEARRQALIKLGGIEQTKEIYRDRRGIPVLETLFKDVRYALRILAKNPGFAAAAVATLALGVSVNTIMFTAIDAVALRPLAVRDANRVVRVVRWVREGYGGTLFSYPEYAYYQDRNAVFTGLVAKACCYDGVLGGVQSDVGIHGAATEIPEKVSIALASGNLFTVLGVDAVLGRTFRPDEDRIPGSHPVAVLSYAFWQRRFASDPGLVGKILAVNGAYFTVVGIAPPDFVGTADPPVVTDLWVPMNMHAVAAPGSDWDANAYEMRMAGRLKPGVSAKQAEAQMTILARQLARSSPDKSTTASTIRLGLNSATFMSFSDTGAQFKTAVALLMAAVGMILLIACANLVNLFLARATARQREIAVRLALGASRPRLIRQLLTEGVLIALLGGAAGLVLSIWTCNILWAAIRGMVQRMSGMDFILRFDPDVRVLSYALAASLVAAVAFALAPAIQATRPSLSTALKGEGTAFGQGLRHSSFRNILIGGQVAVSLVLLVGAGLLVRGLARGERVNTGFETKKVLLVEFSMESLHYDKARIASTYDLVLQRLHDLPGVEVAGFATHIPLLSLYSTSITVDDTKRATKEPSVSGFYNGVSPGYFQALDVRLVRGRSFTAHDGASPFVIVSEATARRLWPGEDPIGKRLKTSRSLVSLEVIGVAKDARNVRLSEPDPAFVYLPITPDEMSDSNLKLFVRTAGEPESVLPALRSAFAGIDQRLFLTSSIHPLELGVWFQKLPSRIGAIVASILGSLGLALSAVGIYGIVTYTVSQRTREIGIRMALGADRHQVLRLMLVQGARIVAIGMALGLAGSFAVSRILAAAVSGDLESPDLLFGVDPLDPLTFVGVSLFLTAIALCACYIPARRAMNIDPISTLRHE